MAMVTYQEWKPAPAGLYPAKIAKIEGKDGSFGPSLNIQFTTLVDANGIKAGSKLFGMVPATIGGPKSRTYRWLVALGVTLTPGQNFDPQTLIGKQVMASVLINQGSNGKTYSNVTELYPFDEKMFSAPVQQAVPVQTAPIQAAPVQTPVQAATVQQAPAAVAPIQMPTQTPSIGDLPDDDEKLF